MEQEEKLEQPNEEVQSQEIDFKEPQLPDIDLPESIEEILEDPNLPEESKVKIVTAFMTTVHHFSSSYAGPIPDPDSLRQYEDILPGSADRILKMAENQGSHRRKREIKEGDSRIKQSSTGQWMGFLLALTFMIIAAYLTINGYPIVGGLIATTTIGIVITAFVLGKKYDRADPN